MSKAINKELVVNTALNLIKETNDDNTTTLQIKESLRKAGYYATQREVSSLVQEAVDAQELEVRGDNGTYRFFNKGVNAPRPKVVHAIPANAPTVKTIVHRDGTAAKATAIPETLTKSGDWKVTNAEGTVTNYFLGKLTRDEVRSAFAKLNNVKFVATRSSRIK